MTATHSPTWQLSEERRIALAQRRLIDQLASGAWWSCRPRASPTWARIIVSPRHEMLRRQQPEAAQQATKVLRR